ncbi:hypothetical protein AOLI_G00160710 [Acnodon oligacanthus]
MAKISYFSFSRPKKRGGRGARHEKEETGNRREKKGEEREVAEDVPWKNRDSKGQNMAACGSMKTKGMRHGINLSVARSSTASFRPKNEGQQKNYSTAIVQSIPTKHLHTG